MRAMVWALDQKVGSIVRKMVLIKLCDNADDESGECFPSIDSIADVCECDRRTVQRHLKRLAQDGLVTVLRRGGRRGGRNVSSKYRVNGDWPRRSGAKTPETPNDSGVAESHIGDESGAAESRIETSGGGRESHLGAAESHPNLSVQPINTEPEISDEPEIVGRAPRPSKEDIEALCESFERHLPKLPKPQRSRLINAAKLHPARHSNLAVIWAENEDTRETSFWDWFFSGIAELEFYRGDASSGWKPRLGWFLESENFADMCEEIDALAEERAA